MARLEAEGLDYLQTVEMQFGSSGDVECVVRFGDPVDEILREADGFGADLIAVTTEGRSALGRVVLGSVAEEVVRKADAPVNIAGQRQRLLGNGLAFPLADQRKDRAMLNWSDDEEDHPMKMFGAFVA